MADFSFQFNSLKRIITTDYVLPQFPNEVGHKCDIDDYNIAVFNAWKMHESELESLVASALAFPKIWGTDEKGDKRSFTILTEPTFTLKDGTQVGNPFFFVAMTRLFSSDRMKDIGLRNETILQLIQMYDNDEYRLLHRGINNTGSPYKFLMSDTISRKWPQDIQNEMKKRLLLRIAAEKDVDTKQLNFMENGNENGIAHSRLRFFWRLDWTAEEKSQLVDVLRPTAMRADPLDQRSRYEWLALLILCDCGDKAAMEYLYNRCKEMDYLHKNMVVLQKTLPFLTLVRRRETVETLSMLMAREDILDKPRSFLWEKGSLASISATCLSIMLEDMPDIHDKKEWAGFYTYQKLPKKRCQNILSWLQEQKEYRFKDFNYFPIPHDDNEKYSSMSFITLGRLSRMIFGLSITIENLPPLDAHN
ncbi:MAG: hypothetical protein IKZ84_12830 [Victivallales bacterium]|nr:hypothetical protein [Victivallales bacterium]